MCGVDIQNMASSTWDLGKPSKTGGHYWSHLSSAPSCLQLSETHQWSAGGISSHSKNMRRAKWSRNNMKNKKLKLDSSRWSKHISSIYIIWRWSNLSGLCMPHAWDRTSTHRAWGVRSRATCATCSKESWKPRRFKPGFLWGVGQHHRATKKVIRLS